MTGVNRAWGKSTTPIPDFPQALFVRVNIGAQAAKLAVRTANNKTFEFPYASKWIGMNILSLDPETVVVDPFYKKLIALLQDNNYNVVEAPLTHARTIGGGWHCVTCDLERT